MTDIIARAEEASTGENYSLITYYNYIKSWNMAFTQRYDSTDSFKNEIRKPASNNTRATIYATAFDKLGYIRGILTLQLMRCLPVDERPEFTFPANIWLPVQSYYAIEGAGLALLSIRLQNPPRKSHPSFCSNLTDPILRTLFPYPFNGLCSGGPLQDSYLFKHLDTTAAEVKALSNISCPSESNVDTCIGKSLSTTRKRMLEKKYRDRRKEGVRLGCTRRNLSLEDKKRLWDRNRYTSICDFIYRMRERSNYEDHSMYLHARDDLSSAVSHYKELLHITEALVEGIDTLIEFYLGKKELDKIKSELEPLEPFERPEIEDIPF